MERRTLTPTKPYQVAALAGLALLASALVAVGILYAVRSRVRGAPSEQDPSGNPAASTSVPIQPAVDTIAPAHVPHHFSESLIVPGFTETGTDVERQDRTDGRSPGGV
jgi:hypothetical protein